MEKEIAERLMRLPSLGPMRFKQLIKACGGGLKTLLTAPKGLWMSVPGLGIEAYEAFQELMKAPLPGVSPEYQALNAQFVYQGEEGYPLNLKNLEDAPIGVYGAGDWAVLKKPCIAIVGSRRATLYGQKIARQLGHDLAQAGCCIVSGLALGIDAAAHEGALDAGGATVAVLGCGLDVVYPPENLALYKKIAQKGLLFSEFYPGRRADRQTFPRRNRLVSGLSRGVIVVESDVNGGSMITANFAAQQGCSVYAVPGRVDQVSSRGCHALIREGATLITHAQDVLEDLGWSNRPSTQAPEGLVEQKLPLFDPQLLPPGAQALLKAMQPGEPYAPDALGALLDLPPASVSSQLMLLELKRVVMKRIDGTFERRF